MPLDQVVMYAWTHSEEEEQTLQNVSWKKTTESFKSRLWTTLVKNAVRLLAPVVTTSFTLLVPPALIDSS
jgi:hypothetical protein